MNAVEYLNNFGMFSEGAQQWINDILVWIGFGTLVGLLARAIMPGRDPGGAVTTLAMGIGGTILGCGAWSLATQGARVTPVSPIGILVATVGAFMLLFFYRLFGGHYFEEGNGDVVERRPRRRRSRRRRSERYAYYD
jgi:uncharacterized membrane protein YeaQ/YmgE (transglycosylase-associated protein family)